MENYEQSHQSWKSIDEHKKHEARGTRDSLYDYKGSWEKLRFDDKDKEGDDSWE